MTGWIVGGIFLIMTGFKLKELVAPTQRQHEQRQRRYGTQQLRTLGSVQQIVDILAHLLLGLGFAAAAWEEQHGAPLITGIDLMLLLVAGAIIAYSISLGLLFYLRSRAQPSAPLAQQNLSQLLERVTYRSISPAEIDPAADHRVPALNAELEALGFRFLGPMEVKATLSDTTELEVTDLFASPDGSSFAEPEHFFGSDALALRTQLDDGTIIETTLLSASPSAGPRRLRRMWPRKQLPRAGYLVELRAHGAVRELWARHQERVSAHTRASGHAPLAHSDPERYFDLSRQSLELGAQRRAAEIILTVLALTIGICLVLFNTSLADIGARGGGELVDLALLIISVILLTLIGLRLALRLLTRSQLQLLGRLISG